jgi:hypothetical protein
MSAFCTLFCALVRFWTSVDSTPVSAVSWLMEAPMLPRCAATVADGSGNGGQRRLGQTVELRLLVAKANAVDDSVLIVVSVLVAPVPCRQT